MMVMDWGVSLMCWVMDLKALATPLNLKVKLKISVTIPPMIKRTVCAHNPAVQQIRVEAERRFVNDHGCSNRVLDSSPMRKNNVVKTDLLTIEILSITPTLLPITLQITLGYNI